MNEKLPSKNDLEKILTERVIGIQKRNYIHELRKSLTTQGLVGSLAGFTLGFIGGFIDKFDYKDSLCSSIGLTVGVTPILYLSNYLGRNKIRSIDIAKSSAILGGSFYLGNVAGLTLSKFINSYS